MAAFQGIEDFVAAVTGGGAASEQEAYNASLARLTSQRSAQALLDKRIEQANREKDINVNRGNLNTAITDPLVRAVVLGGVGADYSGAQSGEQTRMENEALQQAMKALTGIEAKDGQIPADLLNAWNSLKSGSLLGPGNVQVQGQATADLNKTNADIAKANAQTANAGKTSGGSVRTQKIADAQEVLGMSLEDAVKLVDGYVGIEFDPTGGGLRSIDEVNRSATEIPVGGGTSGQIPPAPPVGQTLYDLAEQATGPVNTAIDLGGRAASLLGIPVDQPATEAIQGINTATQNMIRALAINPRFPVGEMERLRKEINIQPGALTGVDILQKRMGSVARSLELRMQQADRDANDPSLDQNTRESQRANASAIRNFLPLLIPSTARNNFDRDAAYERASQVEGFNQLSPEDQQELIQVFREQNP